MLLKITSRHSGEKFYLRKFCLIIISLAFVSIQIHAQNGWTKKTNIPTPLVEPGVVVVNNKIYVLGGADAALSDYDDNQVYNPSTDTWETKKPLTTPRGFLSATVVNDTIYAIGGSVYNTTSIVEAYDPATDTWTQKANMLAPRFAAAACVVDGIIYNIGGNHTESNCEAYNPATNTWTRKTDIPETYGGIIVAPYGGLLYAFGGGFHEVFQTVYVYDPKTDGWTKKEANMPTARGSSHSAPVVDGKIYIIGGYKSVRGEVLSNVEVYDPILDSWIILPDAPFKLALFGAAVVNGKIYIIGGTPDWSTLNDTVWEYTPPPIPVELTSFTAKANGKEVTLNWSTATELNNQGFEVQRKFGSNDFVTIGSVKGNGTTTSPNQYSYVDKLIDPGRYFYRLKQIDFDGAFEYSKEIEVEVRLLDKFNLEQNYPNPFNPTTKISWQSPVSSRQILKVYDVIGNEVATLVDKEMDSGYHSLEFNASDLPSGVYFYQLKSGEFLNTKKMLLLK